LLLFGGVSPAGTGRKGRWVSAYGNPKGQSIQEEH